MKRIKRFSLEEQLKQLDALSNNESRQLRGGGEPFPVTNPPNSVVTEPLETISIPPGPDYRWPDITDPYTIEIPPITPDPQKGIPINW